MGYLNNQLGYRDEFLETRSVVKKNHYVVLHCDGLCKNVTVAVMGCAVNGPGEAREADVGIAGGEDCGVLFVKGELKERLPYEELLPALLRYVEAL